MGRGQLNKSVRKIAKIFFQKEISVTELRLLPYIQYALLNEQTISMQRINCEELEILESWRKKGYLIRYQPTVEVTREFWDFMCEVLWHTYVCRD